MPLMVGLPDTAPDVPAAPFACLIALTIGSFALPAPRAPSMFEASAY